MSRTNDIDSLLQQLKQLRIEADQVIECIIRLQETNTTNSIPTQTNPRIFEIGQKAQILNPNRLQENTGVVCNIGKCFITIKPKKGIKILRESKNLQKIE